MMQSPTNEIIGASVQGAPDNKGGKFVKTYHRRGRSLLAAFLAVVMLFSLMPTAFAAQEDN